MHVIVVACALVFTFTIAECKHLIDKRQEPPCSVDFSPDLQECMDALLESIVNSTALIHLCSDDCRAEIQSYFEICDPSVLEDALQTHDQLCGESPSGSGDDACLPINFSSELEDCLNSYASITPGTTASESPACTSECRYEIEDYADRCLNATAQMYKDEYRSACGGKLNSCDLRVKH